MKRTADRSSNNRDPTGRNNNQADRNEQSGAITTARDNPLATAIAVGGAVAAGVFLWSRRNQISDQIGNLSEQISDWRENSGSDINWDTEARRDEKHTGNSEAGALGNGRSQVEIAQEALTLKEMGTTQA